MGRQDAGQHDADLVLVNAARQRKAMIHLYSPLHGLGPHETMTSPPRPGDNWTITFGIRTVSVRM